MADNTEKNRPEASISLVREISVEDAWAMLQDDPAAVLVDVRTQPEWIFVGLVDLSDVNKEPILIEWQSYPGMDINPRFADLLAAHLKGREEVPILFLCRSGVRSRLAAERMAGAGFQACFNISGGFEGPVGPEGHRDSPVGWKGAGLPWRQT